MVKRVDIRTLKDRLSAFVRDVQRGDVILITDRDRVVAELRPPTVESAAHGTASGKLGRLAAEGVVKLGLSNRADAYRKSAVHLPRRRRRPGLDSRRAVSVVYAESSAVLRWLVGTSDADRVETPHRP